MRLKPPSLLPPLPPPSTEYHDTMVAAYEARPSRRALRYGMRHQGAFKELTALAQGLKRGQQPSRAAQAEAMARQERLKAQRALHYNPS